MGRVLSFLRSTSAGLLLVAGAAAHAAGVSCGTGKIRQFIPSGSHFNSPLELRTCSQTSTTPLSDPVSQCYPTGLPYTFSNGNRRLTAVAYGTQIDANGRHPIKLTAQSCATSLPCGSWVVSQGYEDYWNTQCVNDPCTSKSGQASKPYGTGALPSSGKACISGCETTVGGWSVEFGPSQSYPGGNWVASSGTYTGLSCVSGTATAVEATVKTLADGAEGVCAATTGAASNACISLTKKNCGYVNGEYRCITAAQLTTENPCVTTASGAQFCKSGAATPPAPDNGTPGTVATRDGKFSLNDPSGNAQTVNYYTSTTVNGSSGNPGSDAGSNAGDGSSEGGIEGSCGDSSDPCHVEIKEDEFGAPGAGAGWGELDGEIEAAMQALSNARTAARGEVEGMWGGLGEGTGSLPCKQFTFRGNSVEFCLSQWEEQLAVLGLIVLGIATLGAAAIIMGE